MSYTQVFGGTTIYPSDVSYLAIALDADAQLDWPLESAGSDRPAARIIDITPNGVWTLSMPPANETGVGQTTLFNNLGPYNVTILDAAGNTLLSLAEGQVWQAYLTDNSTVAGAWRTFRYGATTATAQAAALAGAGLVAIGSVLATASDVEAISVSYSVGAADRAKTFVWGGGASTLTLPSASTVGNNFFINLRNGGSGTLTVDPDGGELINGQSTLAFQPTDSAVVVSDGANWYTIGFGQNAVFAFDYTVIDLTSAAATYTLTGSQLNRVVYKFEGLQTNDVNVVVPGTIQQYWCDNSTTGGSYAVTIGTSGQSPTVALPRNERGIYYCNGTIVLKANTVSGSAGLVAIADGGTGANTATGALTNLGGTSVGRNVFTATTAAAARSTLSAAASGANSDITSLTGLTTALSRAQGGTGVGTAPTSGQLLIGNGSGYTLAALTAGSGITITNASGSITIAASGGGGGGSVTSVNVSGGSTGLSFSGGPITTTGTITMAGTLAVASGGTGATTLTGILKGNGTSAVTTVTAPTGALVGTTDAQTISSKIIRTCTIDADITVSDTQTIAATSPGFRGAPILTKTATYAIGLTDAGKLVSITTGGVSIPANGTTAFPTGTTISVYNNSGSTQTITITTDTLRLAGSASTGTRTIAVYGLATLVKVDTTVWVASGNVT